jgi:hypothetical protein
MKTPSTPSTAQIASIRSRASAVSTCTRRQTYVQDEHEARAAVAATRYPPEGVRGVSGLTRATRRPHHRRDGVGRHRLELRQHGERIARRVLGVEQEPVVARRPC